VFGCLHVSPPLPEGEALVVLARSFTPRIEIVAAGTVLLDLAGFGRVWPTPESLGRAIVDAAAARHLALAIALAWSRRAALLVARARPGLTVVPAGEEAAALAPLPLESLELDDDRCQLLKRWGLVTLGDLAALPAKGLSERFGPDGPRWRRLARGEDDAPMRGTPLPEAFSCALELDWPVDGLEPLSFFLARVLDPLCATLTARGRRAAAMTLDLAQVDGRRHRRTLKPAAPSADARTWRTLLRLDLETNPPKDAIQTVAVSAVPTLARAVQFSLLDPAQPSPERMAETLARLHEWTAAARAGAPRLIDSHRPGAFVMETFDPRPFVPRLLASAAPLRVVLRVFRPPLPARVDLAGGAPAFVSASGVRGAVEGRAGPWRASGDWWDVAWSREEWDVRLAGGGLYRVFRDRLREAWFVEGELD
jgi:protein ImuB